MKKISSMKVCFMLLPVFIPYLCINAQFTSEARITNTDFEIDGNKMIITYDIENYSENESFYINAEIFNEAGEKIISKSFSGDIKGNIKGGRNKTVIWDMSKDIDKLEGSIYVEITAIPEAISGMPEKGESTRSYSIAGTLIPSLVFPGYGNTKVKHKPYWILGLAGYGSIITSYMFNKSAASSYDKYKTEINDEVLRFMHYDDAVADKNISLVFGAAAGAIWAADVTLLVLHHKKQKEHISSATLPNASINYGYKPYYNCNMLTLKITF
jgi:hypothetical protein